MFFVNIKEALPLLLSVKYKYGENTYFDYSKDPRPCHNVVFILDGYAEIATEREFLRLSSGEILFIPKGSLYSAKWYASPQAVFHALHFSFSPENDPLQGKILSVQKLSSDDFSELYGYITEIERFRFSQDEHAFFALSAFYRLCGVLLPRLTLSPEKNVNKTLAPAIRYIKQHYAEKFPVDRLAELCYLSPSRFYHLFKEQTGASPVTFKNKLAIDFVAQDLLYYPEKSISEIAKAHGFSEIVYFERLFKRFMKKSPSAYRKETKFV